MLNIIILQGRLTKEPELKQTQTGKGLVRFDIAVNRRTQKDHSEADFFNIVAWNKTAEFVCQYFHKGDQIIIEGNVKTGIYEDNNGTKRKNFEVWANNVNFAGSKKTEANTDDWDDSDDGLPF